MRVYRRQIVYDDWVNCKAYLIVLYCQRFIQPAFVVTVSETRFRPCHVHPLARKLARTVFSLPKHSQNPSLDEAPTTID